MKTIELNNFRCYTKQNVEFRREINLLIGDNASGKTSILRACKYVLSAFFSGFSDENTKWISPLIDDFSIIEKNGIILPEKPIILDFICSEDMYDRVHSSEDIYKLVDDLQIHQLRKNSKKNSRSLISGITGYRDYAKSLYDNFINEEHIQVYALPLFAGFSTEDIHSSRKIDSSKFHSYAQKPSFGYYECLDGEGFFPYWIKRLLILREGQKNEQEIEIVRNAVISALGIDGCNIIQDMQIRINQKTVYYIFTDGREVAAEHLSDGYRRLVNIVTDIAFRCALLNRGIYGLESAKTTKGTVLIDEVDLHLHPTLQALVLKGLRNAFPQIQFIVTTHAPMVMTGVESNEKNIVYKLEYSKTNEYSIREVQPYGMDISTITEVILDQVPRDLIIDKTLTQLFDFIDNNKITKARDLLEVLKNHFADHLPDLAQAEAMLNFTIEDDEEN